MIDFWNRWHMTLSQFLREYLYFTLGGNKLGKTRRLINMMITMLLGGLWHGAGWTFIVWGGLHGAFLVINHLFRELFPIPEKPARQWHATVRSIFGWAITTLAVVTSMTVFRATSLGDAIVILQAMAGITSDAAAPISKIVDHADDGWNMVILVSLIALFAPNTQEIMSKFQPAWDKVTASTRWQWRPHPALAILTGLALALSIVNIGQVSEFLYFQF